MNVNKKLGRLKQWAGERMGGEARTTVSDDFKALEAEMGLRNEGTTANHKAMSNYIRAISKRDNGEDKEKVLPVAFLGTTMTNHGEDFENDSEFGQCLIAMGRTNERIARIQDSYIAKANTSWLDSLERSLAQMKDYQKSRKNLESRRLAYDTAQSKLEKSRREDFRAEEEVRSQKAKYEEAVEDVYRRMQDIQEAEGDSVGDLTDFLEAQLAYYAKCHEAMLQLRQEWPAASRLGLSRQSTRSDSPFGEPALPERPAIRSIRSTASSAAQSPQRELPGFELGVRPGINRSSTYDGPTSDPNHGASQRMIRVPSDTLSIRAQKAQLRSGARAPGMDVFEDPSDGAGYNSNGGVSPGGAYSDRAPSPATSVTSSVSSVSGRKPPPPPPPSRSKKPPPPPPPMKRSGLSVQTS